MIYNNNSNINNNTIHVKITQPTTDSQYTINPGNPNKDICLFNQPHVRVSIIPLVL